MDKGAWKATVHGASKSPDLTEHTRVCMCVCVCVCIIYNFYEQISQVQTFRAQPIYISDCLLLQDIKCQMNRGMYLPLILSYLLKCRTTLIKETIRICQYSSRQPIFLFMKE